MTERLAVGTTVAHYRIVSRIGAGGMGEVYKAHDLSLDRPVALKVLPADLVKNDDRVRRFAQEARAASSLSHPHIVSIYEVGELPADGQTTRYIAMEFVNGVTLKSKIHDQRTALRELLEYLAQAADALAKAHAAGIIHRDLKPENIMVTQDGYAKVLDFGLAKLTEKTAVSGSDSATAMREQTREGVVLGTLGYMSPEQVQRQELDHRSDIFSFGCILYEAATRQQPFAAQSDIDVLHRIVHSDPPSIAEVNASVPAELRRLIRRCLAKDPDRRYQSMKDIAIELRDLSQEYETLSTGSSSAPIAALRSARWRFIAAVALAAIGIAALIAALILRSEPDRKDELLGSVSEPLTTRAGVETQPRISPDGNYIVYAGRDRGNYDIYLQRLGGLNPINLTDSSADDDMQPAISPDGQRIAFRSSRDGGGIFVMGATGESVRRIIEAGYNPAWSPDGKEIVYSTAPFSDVMNRGSFGELWRVDVERGTKKKIETGSDAVQPAFSPDGHRIAFWGLSTGGGGIRDISTVSAAGGERVPVTDDREADWNPIWSADGKYLYFISDRGGTMGLWRVAIDQVSGKTTGPFQQIHTPARNVGFADVSRDGRKLVFASMDSRTEIDRLNLDPKNERAVGAAQTVIRGSLRASQCDASPDGQWVVFRGEGEREDLYMVKADGTELRKVTDDVHRDRAPRWTPDGKRILFYSDRSGQYEIWSIRPDGGGLLQITERSEEASVWFPRLSPDGTRLMVHNQSGTFVTALPDQLPIRKLDALPATLGNVFRGLEWSPDGRWIGGNLNPENTLGAAGLMIYSLETGEYQKLTDSGGFGGWLSDSRRILYRDRGQVMLVDRITRRTKSIAPIDEYIEPLANPATIGFALSPDSRSIYYTRMTNESDIWLLTFVSSPGTSGK